MDDRKTNKKKQMNIQTRKKTFERPNNKYINKNKRLRNTKLKRTKENFIKNKIEQDHNKHRLKLRRKDSGLLN